MQQKPFEIHKAPVPPLRAEPRLAAPSGGAGHVQGVQATPGGLIRSTILAGGGALAILVLFWLPAEYGIDPTGVGGLLGLTEMGDIKTQLAAEAAADDAAAAAAVLATPAIATPVVDTEVRDRLAAIESQLAAIAAIIGADAVIPVSEPVAAVEAVLEPVAEPVAEPITEPVPEVPAVDPVPEQTVGETPPPEALGWRDEVSYTLPPGEGVEVKLVMEQGAVATFEWTANGGVVNYETHADDGGTNSTTYEEGRAVPEQTGTLTAAFTGNHGWFWRNRSDAPLTLTLRTAGAYSEMKAP